MEKEGYFNIVNSVATKEIVSIKEKDGKTIITINHNNPTPSTDLIEAARKEAIDFAKWLQHTDNGTEHYNPFTKEISDTIGYSPWDCLNDEVHTIEELYVKWKELLTKTK